MIPVIDLSRYQGTVDFNMMVSHNVQGVICRAGNGVDPDPTFLPDVAAAKAAGLKTGAYWFCNPKIGSAAQQGQLLADAHTVAGCEIPPMLDIESFARERGTQATPSPSQYAAWLHLMVAAVEPTRSPILYSNASFWNPNVGSPDFGGYDIIVARYPFYSPNECAAHVPPADAALWGDWIMAETTARPQVPAGWVDWSGWQFSAGYNGRASTYGAQGNDLDLNIIRPEVWARWTGHDTQPTTSTTDIGADDMVRVIANGDNKTDTNRWSWNGQVKVHLTLSGYNFLLYMRMVDPSTTLDAPIWMDQATLDSFPTVA